MALIIEDGTGKVDATSYATVIDTKAYALARGVTLGTDSSVEILLIKAMDYLEAQADRYKGEKANATQALQWPRACVVVYGQIVPTTSIPIELVRAQMSLAMASFAGIDIMPNETSGKRVKRRKVGPIEVEYSESSWNSGIDPTLSSVDGLLKPLYKSTGFGNIPVQRV